MTMLAAASVATPARRRRVPKAVSALAGQGSQAVLGLATQVIAAHLLAPAEWGVFAVLYGVLVLVAACVTGFVGDSLTVLDRREPLIRSALQSWAAIWFVGAPAIVGLVAGLTGFLSAPHAALFALAAAAFAVEEIARRRLMAALTFWRLVAVDVTGLVVLIAAFMALHGVGVAGLGLALLAVSIAQTGAVVTAVVVLPRDERGVVPVRRGALGTVAAYGSWRSAQQMVRPSLLTVVRLVVTLGVGAAATGDLEAARVFVAPILLIVGGLSTYLFSTFAASALATTRELLARADRSVLLLLGLSTVVGAIGVLLSPALGFLVAGRDLDVWSVVGWVIYSISVAGVTPYGSLAAVRGAQSKVLGVRVADSLVSLASALLLVKLGGPVQLVPLALCGGSTLGGLAVRRIVVGVARRDALWPPSPEATVTQNAMADA